MVTIIAPNGFSFLTDGDVCNDILVDDYNDEKDGGDCITLAEKQSNNIIVRALNSYGLSRTWIIQGPNKSAAHSSNEIDWISHSGKCPYPLPSSLLC